MKNIRIAFLLTLYMNESQSNIFIKQLLRYQESYIFIHIDKKSDFDKNKLIVNDRIKILPEQYVIDWGDYSQIDVTLRLMEFAKKCGDYDYYSVHSGNDIVVKPINELVDWLSDDSSYAYLDCEKLPYVKFQYGGGLGRIALKWPKFFRKKCRYYSITRLFRSLYGKAYGVGIIKGKKLPENISFYGQSDWFTLSNECVGNILQYIDENKEYLELFKDSLIGSEIFFNTLAIETGRSKKICLNNNLRYIDFDNIDKNTPGSPKLLTIKDYDSIIKSDMFFARKVDVNDKLSNELIKKFLI